MKTIITYGTFDLLHYGHIRLLKRAKLLGDRLVVGLSTDEFNSKKGKKCVRSFKERKEVLEAIEDVNLVFEEKEWEQKIEDIKRFDADIFIMGNDWSGKFDYLEKYCTVIYVPRTEGISTTQIKEELSFAEKKINENGL